MELCNGNHPLPQISTWAAQKQRMRTWKEHPEHVSPSPVQILLLSIPNSACSVSAIVVMGCEETEAPHISQLCCHSCGKSSMSLGREHKETQIQCHSFEKTWVSFQSSPGLCDQVKVYSLPFHPSACLACRRDSWDGRCCSLPWHTSS